MYLVAPLHILSLSWDNPTCTPKKYRIELSHAMDNIFFKATTTRTKNLLQVKFIFQHDFMCAYIYRLQMNTSFLANASHLTVYVTVILFIGTDCTYVFFQNLHHHTYVLLHWVYEIEFYKFLYFSRVCSEISYLSLQHVQHWFSISSW